LIETVDVSRGQPLVAETLARMDDGWSAFRRRVHAMPGQLIERRLAQGSWTRKQMLAHISTWHERTVEALGQLTAGELPGEPEETDVINARAARAAIGRTTGEILFALDDSYRQVHRAVSRLTDDLLLAHDGWATAMIAGNTYGHYEEHAADLAG
jgi:DinB superfamily